jgi:hypothetical protein
MHESTESVEAAQQGKRRRKWPRRLVLCLFLLPLLFFLLSNALLRIPWCCGWIAAKVSKKIGLETSFVRAGWMPGGEFWLEDLDVQQPAPLRGLLPTPLLHVKKISLQPVWGELVKGHRDITRVTVDSPELMITVELLVDVLRRNSPNAPPLPEPAQKAPGVPAAEPTSAVPESKPQALPPAQPAPAPPQQPPAPEPAVQKSTAWLHVINGRLTIFHAQSARTFLDATAIQATVPFEGKEAGGNFTVGRIVSFDNPLAENLQIPLQWKTPVLETPVLQFSFLGLPWETKAQVARVAGLGFQMVVVQKNAEWKNPNAPFTVASIESIHRIGGYLLAPVTWNGESIAKANGLSAQWRNHRAEFFSARYRTILSHGVLQCTDVQALGDDMAVLGNGMVLADGRLAGIVRVTASHSTAGGLEEQVGKIMPGEKPAMGNFMNEDRRVADVLLGGNIEQPSISFDHGKTLLDLRKIFTFFQQQTPLTGP